jgi:AraC family transcriptional regulator
MTEDYGDRLNRVFAYIDRNAGRNLTLEEIAEVGAFSPFHFHRVFKASVGETLHAYILRRRLALAASLLRYREDWGPTRIAMECGFASPSDFSRAFKKAMGKSPRRFRAEGPLAARGREAEPARGADPRAGQGIDGRVAFARLSDERLAFVNCIGVSMRMDTPKILAAFARLHRWSALLGIEAHTARFMGLVSDDPSITPQERLRYIAALVLPKGVDLGGGAPRGIGVDIFPLEGNYLKIGFDRSSRGFAREYLETMERLFKEWMPARSLAPDQRPIVEVYSGSPDGRTLVDVHVPCRIN